LTNGETYRDNRPYFNYSFKQLEEEFDNNQNNQEVLEKIANELSFRKSKKAVLLKDKIKIFEFKENNNRTFASFELKEPLSTKESIFLKGKINKEVYHLEIDNGNNTKSTIEIHLKNPLEKDLTLMKGNKNV